ncbi:nucleotidyltransferase domain-containing protein [Candidatus Woesearchaeota archaeon]|nr:nucleotidyltransferase domain-containing protein [Candidatus Woesearchaeota archaeon]
MMQKLAVREQLVKTAVKSGNGGAVWVPKSWLGQEVVVILPEKFPGGIKEKAIHLLEPYLKEAVSVFIYGSYARGEQEKESDIDIFVITKKDISIKIKEPGVDIICLQVDKLKKAIERHPVMYYQIVQEAEPLINSYILDELKRIKAGRENFRSYVSETKDHIESSRELLELDKLDGQYIASASIVYSAMLRLRGIFIIKCILEKKRFSKLSFRDWLVERGLTQREFEDCYSMFRAVRGNKDAGGIKIKVSSAENLLNILKLETGAIEARLYGK